jgi:hypothetical protein
MTGKSYNEAVANATCFGCFFIKVHACTFLMNRKSHLELLQADRYELTNGLLSPALFSAKRCFKTMKN